MSSAPSEWAEPYWQFLAKHRPKPRVPWDKLVKDSKTQVAYYHPDVTPAVQEELEMRCVQEGHLIKEKAGQRTYYMDAGRCVGASDGEETTFLFVVQTRDGAVHGRPMTRRELRIKGADL